ncbi:MAG: phasin family protein [Alphaproteobacteria bacterium]|nr:phasin family protein [Alphaproteobacteria bacterium]
MAKKIVKGKSGASNSAAGNSAAGKAVARSSKPNDIEHGRVIPLRPLPFSSAFSPNEFSATFSPAFATGESEFSFSPQTLYSQMETMMATYKEQSEKIYGDVNSQLAQGMEGYTRFASSMMNGMQVIAKTYMTILQDTAERNSAAMRNLMACRTLNEATEAQNKLVQENLDGAMSAATRLSEIAIKVCSEAYEPINDQAIRTAKKMSA